MKYGKFVSLKAELKNQKGVALIAVIFILVVMGGIGIAVSKITQNQASTAVNTMQVQKAFYSANAGIDWAWQQVVDATPPFNNLTVDIPATIKTLPGGETFTVSYASASKTLTSTSSAGSTSRVMTFSNFDTVPGGGGGGGGPYPECATTNPVDDTNTWFDQAAASGGIVRNGTIADFALPPAPATCNSGNNCQQPPRNYYGTGNTLPSSASITTLKITGNMRLDNNAQLVINGPASGTPLTVFISGDLNLENNARITVNGNVRFIVSDEFKMDNNAQMALGAGANLLIMANQEVKLDNNALFNSGGNPSNALIMTNDTVRLQDNSNVKGGIYAGRSVTLENNVSVTGAVVSDNNVTVNSGSTVTYNSQVSDSVQSSISGC